ncbi:DUF4870 domain-containing protein [Candidatus Peregrinibacteria bacterium]|nr:DUF4870 domain-containing protein [Candidatus Peregrinibacteria bacterium]
MISSQEKLLGVLAYLGPFFVAPFVKSKSSFCRFHANQGFAFFLTLFVVLILSGISWILSLLLFLAYLAVMLYAMFQAYQGLMWKIPVLFDIASKINIMQLADGWTVTAADSKQDDQLKQ